MNKNNTFTKKQRDREERREKIEKSKAVSYISMPSPYKYYLKTPFPKRLLFLIFECQSDLHIATTIKFVLLLLPYQNIVCLFHLCSFTLHHSNDVTISVR